MITTISATSTKQNKPKKEKTIPKVQKQAKMQEKTLTMFIKLINLMFLKFNLSMNISLLLLAKFSQKDFIFLKCRNEVIFGMLNYLNSKKN
jgi:hypothetical protein